jgi:hypothetical protein
MNTELKRVLVAIKEYEELIRYWRAIKSLQQLKKNRSAVKIQSAWRGHSARRQASALRAAKPQTLTRSLRAESRRMSGKKN